MTQLALTITSMMCCKLDCMINYFYMAEPKHSYAISVLYLVDILVMAICNFSLLEYSPNLLIKLLYCRCQEIYPEEEEQGVELNWVSMKSMASIEISGVDPTASSSMSGKMGEVPRLMEVARCVITVTATSNDRDWGTAIVGTAGIPEHDKLSTETPNTEPAVADLEIDFAQNPSPGAPSSGKSRDLHLITPMDMI